MPRRPAVRLLALLGGATFLLGPAVHAQRSTPRTAHIEFGRNSNANGYASAGVDVRYQFANCAGDIRVLYAMDRESLRAHGSYRYEGGYYTVPSHIPAPRLSVVDFTGPILDAGGNFVASFSDPYTQGGAGAGCLGQSKNVFTKAEKIGADATSAQVAAYLEPLWIRPALQPPLRNAQMESWILAERRRVRDDSIARHTAERSRQDSLARERKRADELARARADSAQRARDAEADRDRSSGSTNEDDASARDDERDEDRERERDDAERARANQASADAQTERLRGMWAIEEQKWNQAEAALARGDLATARPLYEELSGSLVFGDRAKARLAKLNEQQMAEGILAIFSLVGMIDNALDETGLFLGPSYSPTGLPGDKGSAGLTVGFAMSPHQRWVPYVDMMLVSLGSDDAKAERYYPSQSFGALVVGTTTPWLKLRLGAHTTLAPHVGYRAIGTDLEWLHVGQTGLMLLNRGLLLRGDVVLIDGKAQLNGAIARVF